MKGYGWQRSLAQGILEVVVLTLGALLLLGGLLLIVRAGDRAEAFAEAPPLTTQAPR